MWKEMSLATESAQDICIRYWKLFKEREVKKKKSEAKFRQDPQWNIQNAGGKAEP